MRILPIIFLILCTFAGQICGQQTAANALKTEGPQSASSVLYSPDRQHYVAWFDVKAGSPIGDVRPVVFRTTSSIPDLFSFVTVPGQATQAAWNAFSTRCVIGDQPDNGGASVWLVYKQEPDEWLWRKIDPLAPVYAAYRRVMGDRDTPLFRPTLNKIEWLTDTQARFLISCNLGSHEPAAVAGRYFVTIDFQSLGAVPTMTKISDQ